LGIVRYKVDENLRKAQEEIREEPWVIVRPALLPGGGGQVLNKSKVAGFILGAICFTVSQPLLRMKILQHLQQSPAFILAYMQNSLFIGILIAFSAGVFEEGFRFLFRQFVIRPRESDILQPMIFGLGHGIAEAVIVLGPAFLLVPVAQLGLGILERFLVIILHMGLTVTVWNGFQTNRRMRYLLLAILIHGGVNSLIPLLAPLPNAVLLIEGALAVIVVLMTGYIYYSRKYYFRRRESHEQINN
jgi:uncharacterized membrane protein YhfC